MDIHQFHQIIFKFKQSTNRNMKIKKKRKLRILANVHLNKKKNNVSLHKCLAYTWAFSHTNLFEVSCVSISHTEI